MSDAMRILERLTPQGSEYHNDPERCLEYIQDQRRAMTETMHRLSREIRRLTEERDALAEACRDIGDAAEWEDPSGETGMSKDERWMLSVERARAALASVTRESGKGEQQG